MCLFAIGIYACSWIPANSGDVLFYRIIPLDETDYVRYDNIWNSDANLHRGIDYKAENIRLWQKQTSSKINTDDIEDVVYKAEVHYLQSIRANMLQTSKQENTFIKWIVRHDRKDILDLLIIAKQCEDAVFSINDPWFYPVEDNEYYGALSNVVDKCRKYKSGKLLNRYALQKVRALCTLRKYKECAAYWDGIKSKLNDDIVRKMIELRAAAAIYKVGRKEEALGIYAKYGDVSSIRAINGGQIDNELEFVYEHNPNSPYLEGELQKWLICYSDEYIKKSFEDGNPLDIYVNRLNGIKKVAYMAVKEKKTKKMAMWFYVIAAINDIENKPLKAKRYLERGQSYKKDSFLKDSYRVMRMLLDAKTSTFDYAYEQRLMNDLKWLTRKIKKEATPDIYSKLTNHRVDFLDYSVDNTDVYQDKPNTFYWNDALRYILLRVVCPRMHKAGRYVREIQLANMAENFLVTPNSYSSEMFVIIDRLPYKNTRDYFSRIYYPKDEFDNFLNERGRTGKYYWYDIMATKCLRERRYRKALVYLKQIPVSFQKKLNVYDYMNRQPFEYNLDSYKTDSLLRPDYKLHFAESMAQYEYSMKHDRNPNKRAIAKIQYALGLRNSVHRCWTLTRYSSNMDDDYQRECLQEIEYPTDSTIYRHDEYVRISDRLIKEAIKTFTDKELAAKELQKLLYYKRIMDEYGNTTTARDLQRHCDRWRDYA